MLQFQNNIIKKKLKTMKIAILSDIQSNVYALEKVLKHANNNHVDAIVNLGNSLYGPIAPKETYDLIRKSNLINLCGKNDREILEASLEQLKQNKTLNFVYNQLNEEVLYWIQDLPFEKLIGDDFYFVHGTQHDDSVYLLEDVSKGIAVLRDEKKIIELIDDIESKFVACGHSHLARCINLSTGQVVLNPGSVGLQAYKTDVPNEHSIENNTPDATYIILTIEGEKYNISLERVAYEYEKAALLAKQNGREDWAYALRTGKVL